MNVNSKAISKINEFSPKKDLDDCELNVLEFNEAIKLDKRSFITTYWSILKREHLILFTFFIKNDHNIIYIKYLDLYF